MFQWLAAACADAAILADEPRLHELTRRMEAAAREQGAMVPLSLALSYAGARALLAGDLPEAERCFSEITAIAEARGQPWGLGSSASPRAASSPARISISSRNAERRARDQ